VCSACSRIHSAHPRTRLRGRDLQGRGTRVDLVGVRAHGRCGVAAAELSQEALGIALIAHTAEGLLLVVD
jgi:hypothetical protein